MEPLYQLLTALLSAKAPWWLLAIIAAAILLRQVGPIRLNLTIGDRLGQAAQPDPALIAGRPSPRTVTDNTSTPQLPE